MIEYKIENNNEIVRRLISTNKPVSENRINRCL